MPFDSVNRCAASAVTACSARQRWQRSGAASLAYVERLRLDTF